MYFNVNRNGVPLSDTPKTLNQAEHDAAFTTFVLGTPSHVFDADTGITRTITLNELGLVTGIEKVDFILDIQRGAVYPVEDGVRFVAGSTQEGSWVAKIEVENETITQVIC